MKLAAVIFDLDGTLVDSQVAWGKAFTYVLKNLGVKTESPHPQTAGVSVRSDWHDLIEKHNIKTTFTVDELEMFTLKELEKHIKDIHLMDGALEFIGDLKDAGYQLGLATSTNWSIVERVFDSLNLHDIFDCITTGEEIDNPKPFPDIYLVVAEKLGVDPGDCLVIEDSAPGVTAAVEANMKVIAISDNDDEKGELENANLIVENFSKITPKVIDLI